MKQYPGERIRQRREELGYTREELADRAGISTKFLYEIESGRKDFTTAVLARIATEIQVSCDWIVLG